MNFKKLIPLIGGILITASLFGFISLDDDPIKRIVTQLEKWTSDYPQEKVYLHLDKPYYAAGDNIWFKAYVTVGTKHQLTALSGTLNVELINDLDSVKQSIKLPLSNGISWGDFSLPDTLKPGSYRLRAYTNWMRNFSDAYFYDQPLIIGNAVANNVITKTSYTYGPQQTVANITYTDINQTPYAGKPVSYEVKLDNRQVAKNKGTTDAQGNLPISFLTSALPGYHAGSITTHIKVGDKETITKQITFRSASGQTDVQFFPEGGNLVNGITSVVAFKATGSGGLGAAIRGDVLDNQNNKVATLAPQHLGMGSFTLRPVSGKTYHANITYPDGSQNTVNLPQASNSGYVMNVSSAGDNFRVKITASADLLSNNEASEISLIGQSNGAVLYAAKNKLATTAFSASVPKSRFPSGIVQFTLFAGNGTPVAERLAFVRNEADLLKLNVESDKPGYATREHVKVNLHTQNNSGAPVIGAFSAAVINESSVPVDESDESTILSTLLLTSDLQGYIEKPNYYFNNTEQAQSDLDVLLLTQGYRRFEWKSLLADIFPTIKYQPEKSLEISGTLKTPGGKPVANGKVTLFTTTGGAFILDTVTDANGRFAFKNLLFKDSIRFVVQARTDKNRKNVEISLDQPQRQAVAGSNVNTDLLMTTSPGYAAYLKASKQQYDNDVKYGLNGRTIVLKEVVIKDKRPAELKNSSNLNGPGNADQIIKGDIFETMGCATIDQCLQGRLLGVVFRGGVPYSTRSFNQPMQIIVDGIYVDNDYLQILNPLDVASIEVLRSGGYTAIYGGRGGGGVLLINTKRGGDYTPAAYARYAPGIVTYTPQGFYVARQFYKPVYAGQNTGNPGTDLRTTIHWERNIVTDKDGNASFDFYNADAKGTYPVVVEGINNDGYLGRQVYRYKVQ